jgi:multidrug efflux system outer membrane protein
LNTTRATIPPLYAQRTAAQNRLATLTGQSVDALQAQLSDLKTNLPKPPEAIAIGDPASLLMRRPDVRAAEQQLAAATARIGVAKADYFPRISMVGSASLTALSSSGLDSSSAFGYSVGPQLQWGGFDIPRVEAQVNAAGATAKGALAAYEEAVLLAFEETQTSLANYGREKARFEALQEATLQANNAVDIAQVRFDEGVDDFINVLDAQTRLLQAEAALEESRVMLSANVAQVYRALGAGGA